jgi:hypothetical protein
LLNVLPFLLFGAPCFSYACFDSTLYEYDADWSIEDKCFLMTSKNKFVNSKRLADHEAIHKAHVGRRKILLPPFWSYIKVNTPQSLDSKFFDILNFNNHPIFKSLVYPCSVPKSAKSCNFLGPKKAGHEHQSNFTRGNRADLIQLDNGECYFLDRQSEHFYDGNETVWLENHFHFLAAIPERSFR